MNTTMERANDETVLERDLRDLEYDLERYRTDPNIQDLIKSFAKDREAFEPERTFAVSADAFDSEENFIKVATEVLNMRENGRTRWDLPDIPISAETIESADVVIDLLKMREDSEPLDPNFTIGVVLGGAGRVPHDRAKYLKELEEAGKANYKNVAFLGCERPITSLPDKSGKTEVDRAGKAGHNDSGEPIKTEFDLMRNTAANIYGIKDEEWQYFRGFDERIPRDVTDKDGNVFDLEFARHWKIAYARVDGKDIFVTSAPMMGEERFHSDGKIRSRANTDDSLRMIAEMLKNNGIEVAGGQALRVLIATDSIFNLFQGADAKGALSAYGVESETVGFDREHFNLPNWPGDRIPYIQEVLSTLRQTRNARDLLAKTVTLRA